MTNTDMSLRDAAQAVIDRWETPLWKDAPATAVSIADLRDALARDAGRASLQFPGFTAADMATASAQGFRDGAASLAASVGPTCDMRTVVAVAVTMLYDTHPEDVCRVFDRNDLETIVSITEPLGHGRVEDIYRDAWDHVAAPPTAQAEGWISVKTGLPKCSKKSDSLGVEVLIWPPHEDGSRTAFYGRRQSREPNFYKYGALLGHVEFWRYPPHPPTSAEGVEHG